MSLKPKFDPALKQHADYRRLFSEAVPLLDVRAPVEFAQGAFPGAVNLPLMDDQQRHEIGIRYAEAGQDEAIALGRELIDADLEDSRIATWKAWYKRHPNGVLYCFRGGLRSKISQQWLADRGVDIPRVQGGYKALRRFLLDELPRSVNQLEAVVVAGRTGCGKTHFLREFVSSVDLEGLANHMGSAFGAHFHPQPSQIDFENALSVALIRHIDAGRQRLLFEDEGRAVGARRLPACLHEALRDAPIVLLEEPLEARVTQILQDYVDMALGPYQQALGEQQGFDAWIAGIHRSLERIQKRLGGQRYKELAQAARAAEQRHRASGNVEEHRDWVSRLMVEYYDPMYDYQLSRSARPVWFKGRRQDALVWLKEALGHGGSES